VRFELKPEERTEVITEVETKSRTRAQTEQATSDDFSGSFDQSLWIDELPVWAVVTIRLGLGMSSVGLATLLAFVFPDPTLLQAGIVSSIAAFGVGLLSSFFLGKIQFKYKGGLIATGCFALFLVIFFALIPRKDIPIVGDVGFCVSKVDVLII